MPYHKIDALISFQEFEQKTSFTPDPISCFLDVASHLGKLSFSRDYEFKVDEKPLVQAMDQLCETGYAYQNDTYYGWTDKIAPYMLDLYEWREGDASFQEIDPEFIKSEMDKLRGIELNFNASQLMKFWDGKNWKNKRLDEPVLSFDDAIAIVLCFGAENGDKHAEQLTSSFRP